MTDLTREQIEALLDGATQGPWQADGEPWNRIVWSSAENRVCFMAHSNGLDDARDIATSNLVAAAPNIARQLIATMPALAEAQKREAGLREAAAEQMNHRADAMLRRHMNAPEDREVGRLCLRFGYGAVMDAASRLWARNDSLGAFYIGGCIGMRSDDEARAALSAAPTGEESNG